MATMRWVSAGLLLVMAIYIVVLGFVRQIYNLKASGEEDSGWSSPTPFIGSGLFLGAWAAAPTGFSYWGLLFMLLDIETLMVLIWFPIAILKAKFKSK